MLMKERDPIVKIFLVLTICYYLMASSFLLAEKAPPTWVPTPEEKADQPWIPATPDELMVHPIGVSMPLGRILLVRKGKEYLALKFTNTWLGNTDEEHYTSYEFYYQNDGSGDFSKTNVESGSRELFFPGLRMVMGMYVYRGKVRDTILFGAIKMKWSYIAYVDFPKGYFSKGELAPTPWTSITEVNIHDPRIRWYKKDTNRKRIIVPMARLWHSSSSHQ